MKPLELNLYLTTQCNHHCVFCLRYGQRIQAPDVTLELVAQVLERYPTIRSVCIAGFGEPLLSIHLNSIVHYLMAKGIYIGLITNGSLIAQCIEDIEAWQLGYLSVSLNAATSEEHRQITGVSTWDAIRQGLSMLRERGQKFYLSYVIESTNRHRIGKYIEMTRRLGGTHCVLHNAVPQIMQPHDPPNNTGHILTTTAHGKTLDVWKQRYADVKGVEVLWPELIKPFSFAKKCQSPKMSMGIDGHGHFSPCRRCVPPSVKLGSALDRKAVKKAYTEARLAINGKSLAYPCQWCFGNQRG
jgi:MoaA/NifB/PqqE/SkfB family radical SAM enzyme